MKIYNLGSLNIDYVYSVDHFVSGGETLSSENMQIFAGGKGLNQSVAVSRAGGNVIHGAVLGHDGAFLKDILNESGADTSRIEISDKSSGHAIIQLDKNGQNSILLYGGTNQLVDKKYIESFLCDAQPNDILLLQNEVSNLDFAFRIAQKKNMQIAFNPSPYDVSLLDLPLQYVKWWFCNEIEGEALFGSADPDEIAQNFILKYPNSNLILTLGDKGCIFKNAKSFIRQPIYETRVVDTTAAGDTFTGYFISAIAKGKDIDYALKLASKASSIAVSRKGASPSIPYAKELNNL